MAAVFLCLQPWCIRATPPGLEPSGANRSAPTGRRCAGARPSATPAVPGLQGHGAHWLRPGGPPVHQAAGDGAIAGQCDEDHGPRARGGNRLPAPALVRTQPGPGHLPQPVCGPGTTEPGSDERALASGFAAAASLVRAGPDSPGGVARRALFCCTARCWAPAFRTCCCVPAKRPGSRRKWPTGGETLPMLLMVQKGLGVAFAPDSVAPLGMQGLPVLVPLADAKLRTHLNMIWPRGHALPPAAERLKELILAQCLPPPTCAQAKGPAQVPGALAPVLRPGPGPAPGRSAGRRCARCPRTGAPCLRSHRPWPVRSRPTGGAWWKPGAWPATWHRQCSPGV